MIKSIDDWYPIEMIQPHKLFIINHSTFYWRGIKYFLKLNRIPIKNYTGYEIDPKKDIITIYTTNNRYKIPCRKIEELIEVIKL